MKTENHKKASSVMGRITLRLLPLMFLLYLFAYLSRINVGFASLQMNGDLGFGPEVYGIGSGIFFIGYFFLQIPSNMIVERIGVRRWISPIIIACGVIVMALSQVEKAQGFYILRFLLGLVQAGFFPAMILYITYWFPEDKRAQTVAIFLTASSFAGVLGGPLSGFLLEMDGILNLRGWQWVFLIQGFPMVVMGAFSLFYLTDRPEQARWLTGDEKKWLNEKLNREKKKESDSINNAGFISALKDSGTWLLATVQILLIISLYGLYLWLPEIIKSDFNCTDTVSDMLSAIPYLSAGLGTILAGRYSDKTGCRTLPMLILILIAGLTMLVGALSPSPVIRFSAMCIALMAVCGAEAPFWALPPSIMKPAVLACGIAMINSIGNLGGFIGPFLMGYLNQNFRGFSSGLMMLALALLICSIPALMLHLKIRRKTEFSLITENA